MIANAITADKRINDLSSDTCRLAFTWLVTYADCEGRTYGDPAMVRSLLFPRRDDVTTAMVEGFIGEWEQSGLVVWYAANGDKWIWFTGFEKNQAGLRKDHEAASVIPAPPPPSDTPATSELRSNAVVTPPQLNRIEIELNRSEVNAAAPQQQPADPAPSMYGRHVETDPDVAFLFQQVDRAGVFVNGMLGDEQWRSILDVTRDHGLIQEAFADAAASSARQPSPKLLRAILERCIAEGCRPGQWKTTGSSPPGKRETAYERSGRVLDKYLSEAGDGDDGDGFEGAQIVEGKLAQPRDRRNHHPALPPGPS
jgi:hypothetical protein